MSNFESDDLSTKLRAWTVEPQLTGRFQREVWQRIAARQATREAFFWPQVWRWFSTQFVQPQYATVLVALSLLVSIGVARVQAQVANAHTWKVLEARYAISINPLAMER